MRAAFDFGGGVPNGLRENPFLATVVEGLILSHRQEEDIT
jgi:hypothetical protein